MITYQELGFDMEQHYKDRKRYMAALNVPNSHASDDCLRYLITVDRIISNWEKVARQIPVEMVICRRKRKLTDKYQKLIKNYYACKEEIDQAIMMYQLMYS